VVLRIEGRPDRPDRRELTALLASGETVTVRGEGLRLVQAALAPNAPAARAVRPGAVLRLLAGPPARKDGPPTWSVVQWPQAEGAFVALHPETGRVRALVGGFDFGRTQFNRATSAWRQPGSAFKPFLYSAALEHGVMPETRVDDLPLVADDGGTPSWNPGNSDGRFDGEMSLRDALVKSKNLVSIRVLRHIGVPAAREWAARFGFEPAKHPADLTLALGTGSVTPMGLAAGYAVFANGGHRVSPVLIERIVDARGTVLFEAPPPAELGDATRAIPARNAFLTNTLLADVTARGTAARAQAVLARPDLHGKTGTTNDAVDAWFAGWAPGAVAVAWIGHDEPRSLGERESGGGLALPVWIDAMRAMLRGVPVQMPPVPGGIAQGSDWRYEELAAGGWVEKIGVGGVAAVPAGAASAPGGDGGAATPAPAAAASAPR
jgi:penicillin-binding protein 1A